MDKFINLFRLLLVVLLVLIWYLLTEYGVISKFFFGEPVLVAERLFQWFYSGEIYRHLWITLLETILAFALGSATAVVLGLWLALSQFSGKLFDPFITALNAMPRVILAPIFMIWFGLSIWSKVALGFSLVFFLVFYNVVQGVREVSPIVLANARILGASKSQLLTSLYLPSAASWFFSSLHLSVGMAFVGSAVGEYLGSSEGIGYLILQAEGLFDINTVFAGIIVLVIFALILDFFVSVFERYVLVWRPTRVSSDTPS